jgi:hypothetical protein
VGAAVGSTGAATPAGLGTPGFNFHLDDGLFRDDTFGRSAAFGAVGGGRQNMLSAARLLIAATSAHYVVRTPQAPNHFDTVGQVNFQGGHACKTKPSIASASSIPEVRAKLAAPTGPRAQPPPARVVSHQPLPPCRSV